MKIFAIDDEKASLYFLAKAIREACPEDGLWQFCDCEEFLRAFREELPDVAFLDVEMPEINGIELAKRIKEIKNDINIIYVTAFSEYAVDAFSVNASAYIVKPAKKESILRAIGSLRYPVQKEKEITVKTFGNFDVFFRGNPVVFRSPKSKEALAYLVDRQGGLVSKKELGAVIYEEDYSLSVQASLSRNIKYMEEDLLNAGVEDFVTVHSGAYRVNLERAKCDLTDYLERKNDDYLGEYMEQYSWAEYRKANLAKRG